MIGSVIRPFSGATAALALALASPSAPNTPASEARADARGSVVLKAGTIHLVEDGQVLEGGASVVVRDGVIVAAGRSVTIPAGSKVVDYGPDAVIVPGLVWAGASYGVGASSQRTADPLVRAIDNFDVYSKAYLVDAMGGVTTVYVAPTRNRLVGGQGAVVKIAGDEGARVLDDSASIHGTITAFARSVAGYWEPPVPATVDVGLGVAKPQLPGSAMGAVIALDELIGIAKGRVPDTGEYGPSTAASLRELMRDGTPWRLGAETTEEIRLLVEWAKREDLSLVIEGANESGELAELLASAHVPVILTVDVPGESPGRDFGRAEDVRRPRYDNAAKLASAGVEIAIAGTAGLRPRDARFAAQIASRGGLSPEAALRGITLGAAKVLGVDAKVGSIAPGKDADFCVLSGAPMASTTSVLATWIGGEVAWKAADSEAVVIEAEALYLGDGHVLRPGQVSIQAGKIVEVGERVSRPLGAAVVRAPAAMPGIIDALGFLGTDGSQRAPQPDFKLSRIVSTGDRVDRLVAKHGVTTIVLAPRGQSDNGVPMMAYKPAAEDTKSMVLADPAALRLRWTDENRLKSGEKVKELLGKAKEYDKKWRDYEEALKKWTPPPPEPQAEPAKDDKAKTEEKKPEEKKDAASGEKKDEKKDEKKKGKSEPEADPVTGIWTAKVEVPPFEEEVPLRVALRLDGDAVTGSLRCVQVSSSLVALAGTWKDGKLALAGLGTRGWIELSGEPKEGKVEAKLKVGGHEVTVAGTRETKDVVVAKRPEIRREKKEETPEPKGKPRAPGVDEKLEPFRRAMRAQGAIVVNVDREDEILACVAAFEDAGIRPVLYGAQEAWRVAAKIRGRVAGVLLTQSVIEVEDGKGLNDARNRYVELSTAGIPVAFHSLAEEGAADLPLFAAYVVSLGLGPDTALRALTHDAARMMGIDSRVGRLAPGLDGDVILLDGPPLEASTSVVRAFVDGNEVR